MRRRRGGRVVLVLVLALTVLLGGSAFGAYRYDTATRERILPGVTVGGVDVGGMTQREARVAVEKAAEQFLDRRIGIHVGDGRWEVTPAELGGTADVDSVVEQAVSVTSQFGLISRLTSRLLDRPVDREFDLTFAHDPEQVERFVDVVAKSVRVPATRGRFELKDGQLKRIRSRQGRALERKAALEELTRAVEESAPVAEFTVKSVKPKKKKEQSPYAIVVRIAENRLYVYKNMKKVKTYSVATGSPGFPTPRGEWNIWHKAENPTWINPAPDGWGAGMPASIPGGPTAPLGTRALYLDAPGIRIHGTANSGSIGTYASHGCIRMHNREVEQLYEIIPLNTPVFII